jgi:hypothetical protein
MANFDHIHDDNVVPLFEQFLIRQRAYPLGRDRLVRLKAGLRYACSLAFVLRKAE